MSQKKLEDNERKERDRCYVFLLQNYYGRRFLWTLLADECGLFSPSMHQIGKDSLTFYEEGKRAVGVKVMQEIQRISPTDYALMIKERMDDMAQASLNKTPLEDRPTHITVEGVEENEDG